MLLDPRKNSEVLVPPYKEPRVSLIYFFALINTANTLQDKVLFENYEKLDWIDFRRLQ